MIRQCRLKTNATAGKLTIESNVTTGQINSTETKGAPAVLPIAKESESKRKRNSVNKASSNDDNESSDKPVAGSVNIPDKKLHSKTVQEQNAEFIECFKTERLRRALNITTVDSERDDVIDDQQTLLDDEQTKSVSININLNIDVL